MAATQVFSCKYCGIFKIIWRHLGKNDSIRCYFDKINLKQSGFGTAYSFKILVSEQWKNNESLSLKKKKKEKKERKEINK